MSNFSFIAETDWRCACCNKNLQASKVNVEYMGSVFNVELMVCPDCGFVLIPEDLALGKMLQVEQLLEDK
ncbi:MAG: DNA-binding protein [Proteobacteria bacterium]|nr:DNA-binding protein [Pseudomonadota bacterium]MBU1140648.1 DNA-binding protein [Pseudomonadota bacterium]MBU1234578.1 DNA-binding protein [Pseudomonadota bacterium]MBU1417228.1 DNA-binding protein [Pseudomonadota bacterium]MBU1455997.1 DNA-binding protein [Pseudomonadota bacterium]